MDKYEIQFVICPTNDYFKGIDYYCKIAGEKASHPFIIYGGDSEQMRSSADVITWNNLDKIP